MQIAPNIPDRNALGQYVKGRKRDTQEVLDNALKARKTWTEKDEYIHELIEESPYIYNSWRGFMFTEKGKRAGICDAWKTFKTFYSDVRPTYRRGLVLRRPDVDKPISPDNFIWVDPKDAAFFKSNTIQLEYNGEVHSIRDWAIIANTTVSAISIRYHRHKDEWPMERIIFGKKVHRGIKKPRNATSKQDERNKASRMISAYKHLDKERGFDLCNFDVDWMIENILHKCCVYCGDTNKLGCDRIDNNKGHTKDNVVPCCFECNTVRNNYFTYAEMRRLGALIKQIKEERAGIAPRPVR